jgi:hypothetical protein
MRCPAIQALIGIDTGGIPWPLRLTRFCPIGVLRTGQSADRAARQSFLQRS